MVNGWLKTIQNMPKETFPCLLCQAETEGALCLDCQKDLPWIEGTCCNCCSIPLSAGHTCGRCLKSPPEFDHCVALFHYSNPVEWMIKRLKFQGGLVYGEALGNLMAEFLPQRERFCRPDVILPVPLHFSRLKSRGYNQSVELARPIVNRLGLKMCSLGVERVLATTEQSGLPSKLRHQNVLNAFKVKKDFSDMNVVIVDDVMTTGATVNEMAKHLKKAKARRVDVWVVARS